MEKVNDAVLAGFNNDMVLFHENMSRHTTFKTGGDADIFIKIDCADTLIKAINLFDEFNYPYYVIGNGSNILVSDKGIRGAVLQICTDMSKITISDNVIKAQAGALLSSVSVAAMESGLTGFEFASGIPGTIGGAVCMNAGAYDGEMNDVIESVDVLTNDLKICTLRNEELQLSYRNSIISKEHMTVLSAVIRLKSGTSEKIREKMLDFAGRRREKQPLSFPSAGSTFKRPSGYFAGKLIEDSGLKGFAIGGAKVSEKHAGFIINTGGATSGDILKLIDYCVDKVYNDFGVILEPEVKIIGEE